ncbi:MAG: hypothetical protein JSS91_05920 [Bacteroidetes bacterium]|nr:hypothetical protein [Bacteroidota bacterium]
MYILIDYYNLHHSHKKDGLKSLSNIILSNVDFDSPFFDKNIEIRLYGGWYDKNILSRHAQDLAVEINSSMPYSYKDSKTLKNSIVNFELAYSLLSDKNKHLFYTYRMRGVYYGLKSKKATELNCFEPDCPVNIIHNLLSKNACQKCERKEMQSIFYRGEQKLVDSMLTADLIYLSLNKEKLIIITSDDDIWPGVFTSLSIGGQILHIESKNNEKEFDFGSYLSSNLNYKLIKLIK